MDAPEKPQIVWTKEERVAVNRATYLLGLLQSEGWAYVLKIHEAIEEVALSKLDNYEGSDDHQVAILAFSWKAAKAVRTKVLATIKSYVEEGEQISLQKVRPEMIQPQTETDFSIAFPVVKPACDTE